MIIAFPFLRINEQTSQYFAADIAFDESVRYLCSFLCDMLYNTTSVLNFARNVENK